MVMKLHGYFRSSAAYRVRIALALKGLDFEYLPVHLRLNEQLAPEYSQRAANRLVPLLEVEDEALSQSLAIIEYLDETHPEPPLLPRDPLGRARVRALAYDVACEIHPLNNLRVLRYLVHDLNLTDEDKLRWYRHWVESGLATVERRLVAGPAGQFCHGDTPSLADLTLVPQVINAQRPGMECRTDHVPNVMCVFHHCMTLPAFADTQPSRCPDAE